VGKGKKTNNQERGVRKKADAAITETGRRAVGGNQEKVDGLDTRKSVRGEGP